MFLELSRPMDDVSRWEKVLKRLTLLNLYNPYGHPKDIHRTSTRTQYYIHTTYGHIVDIKYEFLFRVYSSPHSRIFSLYL